MARWIGHGAPALLAIVLVGCGAPVQPVAPAPPAPPTPTVRAAGASWAQALTFSGDVRGGMDRVLPDTAATHSECTGRNSRLAGAWASALFGPIGTNAYEVLVTVRPYRGPSTYRAPAVVVQVARSDGSAVWQTLAGDAATFAVGVDEESGTLSATLTNLSTTATSLRVDGRWSCRT